MQVHRWLKKIEQIKEKQNGVLISEKKKEGS